MMPLEREVFDLRYAGGKGLAGLQQWICGQMPPHVHYVENFAGKAGAFRMKTPALTTLLMDRDTEIVNWLTRYVAADPISVSIDGVGSCGHRRGRRGGPTHVRVVRGDGIEWLERAEAECEADWLIYSDPPYHPSTRSKLNLYNYEMSDRDHRRFLRAALRMRCPMMISGYRCDLYMDRLEGWDLKTRMVITRGRTMAEECLWSNTEAAEARAFGMTYNQLGDDYRERERVSKLMKRWERDFSERGPTERRAILMALLNAEAGLSG